MLAAEIFNHRQASVMVKGVGGEMRGVGACETVMASVDACILLISAYQLIGGKWETHSHAKGRAERHSFPVFSEIVDKYMYNRKNPLAIKCG